jgi:1-acyl-sn-glycerol-3-phosphate acyltransferase
MWTNVKGVISLLCYTLNMLVHAILIICSAPIIYLIPIQSWRRFVLRHYLFRFPGSFACINAWIMMISTRGHWDVLGTGALKKDGWYLMISNHASWIDIMVLGKVFYGKIPALKFFMKKELLWQLPFAGLACYLLGYPFMSRHSRADIKKNPSLRGKDIETTKSACRSLWVPTTLINFAEGTRFTEQKKERQQSPYQHLLKPHAGGVAVVLNELQDRLNGIVNVVITYAPKTPGIWAFACGRLGKVVVRYEVLPMTPDLLGDYHQDRDFRPQIQQWFAELWTKNDALIERFKKQYDKN